MSRRWWTLVATGTATALVWTNVQDLSVALPEVSRDLLASLDELQWTITAFMLAGGVLILATGRLADIYGRRLLFLSGIALLTLSPRFLPRLPTPQGS